MDMELFAGISFALASYYRELKLIEKGLVLVGSDPHPTSLSIANILIQGLVSEDFFVRHVGVRPLPQITANAYFGYNKSLGC